MSKKQQSKGSCRSVPKSRHFHIVLNNPDIDDHSEDFDRVLDYNFRYLLFSFENHDNDKTPHIQAYIETYELLRLVELKKRIGVNWNIQAVRLCKKTDKDAWARNFIYVTKELGEFYEFGEPKWQGYRTDLDVVKRRLDMGAREREIADKHFSKWVVYRRSFSRYEHMVSKPVQVHIVELDIDPKCIIDIEGLDNVHVCGSFNREYYNGEKHLIILDEIIRDEDLQAYALTGKQSMFYPAENIYIRCNAYSSKIANLKASERYKIREA